MSVFSIILRISIIVFVMEGVIMFTIPTLPSDFHMLAARHQWFLPLVDVCFLVLLSSPAIYFWTVRPFVLERNQAESLLQAKNSRFVEAQRIGQIGSWEVDLRNDTREWSDEFYRIFKFDPAHINPSYELFLNAVHPEDRETIDTAYAASLAAGTSFDAVYRIVVGDGDIKWVHGRSRTEFDTDGKPLKTIGTAQDITERKEIEKTKSEFVSTVSHELRTPLTSIKGALGLMKGGSAGDLPDKARAMLDIAYNNSDRLEFLINDILDVEKFGAGKMDFQMGTVDLAVLVKDAVEANKGYGDKYGVTLKATGLEEPVFVNGDKDRLSQVMANLMSNAVKFSPKGELVEVSLTRGETSARISVKDNGSGIPETARATIFEKFTQADSSDQRQTGGTGLGLSIAKAIIDEHGGTIEFTSEVGKGTEFSIELKRLPRGDARNQAAT